MRVITRPLKAYFNFDPMFRHEVIITQEVEFMGIDRSVFEKPGTVVKFRLPQEVKPKATGLKSHETILPPR